MNVQCNEENTQHIFLSPNYIIIYDFHGNMCILEVKD